MKASWAWIGFLSKSQRGLTYAAAVPRTFFKQVRSMLVSINRQWCKGCGVCVAFCPKQALRLDEEEKATWTAEKCIGCGMCERYCPDLAIELLDGESKEAQA